MNFDINNWCNKFKALPTEPMSDELSRAMMVIMLGGVKRDAINEYFINKVLMARAEAVGLELEQKLSDFLTFICKSPGDVTMYVSLLRQEQEKGKAANLDNFVQLFPMGFPNQENLGNLWDEQKVSGAPLGNALDLNWWTEENTEGNPFTE